MFIVILGILIIAGFFFLKLACAAAMKQRVGKQVNSINAVRCSSLLFTLFAGQH